MKGRKVLAILTGLITVCVSLTCKPSNEKDDFVRGEEIPYTPTVNQRYTNQQDIDGQWGLGSIPWVPNNQYGIGDPFVMRWNGKYYLYPSTADAFQGVKVYVSDDMINWTYAGYAVSETEATSRGSYAPEVVYYDGYFYMCQSQGGNGHYIYRSKSPTEGFELVSKNENFDSSSLSYGNMGMGIDGSFYVDDDGKLYLLHTSTPSGLKANEISDVNNINPDTILSTIALGEANLNHWIEGPGIFRRGEYSYLTYCGNHVISKGYRIGYSYKKNLTNLSQFIQPVDNITIINTDPNHYGLGHSSNVNGPDLDSVYTAYHSYVGGGPSRRYNLDRYLASGSLLTANGVTHRPVAVPERATKEAINGDSLTLSNGIYTLGTAEGYFTAEYNLIPQSGQILYFGNGYQIVLGDNSVSLSQNGQIIAIKSVSYTQGNLVTVRVENGDGVGYVYLNGMRVISYQASYSAGAIGYALKDGVYYTAFTNDVFGTSDFEAIKNFPTRFPATSYLKGENRGFSIRNAKVVSGGLRVGEKQDIVVSQLEENAVRLGKQDWIKFAVDIEKDDTYSLSARVLQTNDATVKITVGDATTTVTLENASNTNISLGNINLKGGVTTMKVEVVSGEAQFIWFDAQSNAQPSTDNSFESFETLRGSVKVENGKMTFTSADVAGDDAVAVWGGRGMGNYQAQFTFTAQPNSSDFGFMIRSNDYSYHKDQPIYSWRGYYLKLSSQVVYLSRYDYSSDTLNAERGFSLADGNQHTVKIIAKGNSIEVWIDSELAFTAVDDYAFTYGKVGVFVGKGSLTVTDFKFTLI